MDVSGDLLFLDFDHENQPLRLLPDTAQSQYINKYLIGLRASSVIVEPCYFDKDYLDEFSSFYARCSQGYKNVCQRVHLFGPETISKDDFYLAASNDEALQKKLNENYLGFVVLRPIPVAPFGRTVLALYPDRDSSQPRITTPARLYKTHVAGVTLEIEGLAWQQQDTGVAACATVSLWTMFHSSAYDEHHAIPTTADITKSARKFGSRPFPSVGLTLEQIMEAINQQNLNPIAVSGDKSDLPSNGLGHPFSKERFANNVAAFVRSGYPLLLAGHYEGGGGHAICIVGFRDKAVTPGESGKYRMADQDVEYIYAHDDNFGPNLRFRIEQGPNGEALMVSSPPDYTSDGLPQPPRVFRPYNLIAAVNEDVRVSADELFTKGLQSTNAIVKLISNLYQMNNALPPSFTFSPRFILLHDYFDQELSKTLSGQALGSARIALQEKVPPMSLHLGVIRVGTGSGHLVMDILFDTTDSGRSIPSFANIIYDKQLFRYLDSLEPEQIEQYLGLSRYLVPAF